MPSGSRTPSAGTSFDLLTKAELEEELAVSEKTLLLFSGELVEAIPAVSSVVGIDNNESYKK